MDDQLAKKIVNEILKDSGIECAVIDGFGKTYHKSNGHTKKNSKKLKIPTELLEETNDTEYFVLLNKDPELTPAILKVIESIIKIIIKQHHYLRSLSAFDQRADQLAYDYLMSGSVSGPEYFSIAKADGYQKNMNMVAILIEVTDPNYLLLNKKEIKEGERDEIIYRVRRNVENIFQNFYTKYPLSKVLYLGGQYFLVWKNMGPKAEEYLDDFKKTLPTLHANISAELRTKISMGVGNYKKNPENMKESFIEAETAIKFGKQNWGPNKVYSYDDFGAIAPMYNGAIENNLNFTDEVIEKVKEHEGLLKTLEEFVNNELSLTKTAKKLRIHRNTLVYRLDKIFEITGLDPKVFNDAFELKIALIMEKNSAH